MTGASRSGKTSWIASRVHRARRMLVWDTVGEWAMRYDCSPISSFDALAGACKPGSPAMRVAFQPRPPLGRAPAPNWMAEQFAGFCELAYIALRAHRNAVTLIVEELADVTSPGKAPAAWGAIARRGLRYGPQIYAVTQRPSESDKTVMGNASVFHCHAMARADDARYMAKEMRVVQARIDALKPLEFIERNRLTGAVTTGSVLRPRRAKV